MDKEVFTQEMRSDQVLKAKMIGRAEHRDGKKNSREME